MSLEAILKEANTKLEKVTKLNGDVEELKATVSKTTESLQHLEDISEHLAKSLETLKAQSAVAPGIMPKLTSPKSAEAFLSFTKDLSKGSTVKLSLNTETPSEGGYLVPEEWYSTLLGQIQFKSVLFRYAQVIPQRSKIMHVPFQVSGPTATFPGEGSTGTNNDPVFDSANLELKKVISKVLLTDEFDKFNALYHANQLLDQLSTNVVKAVEQALLTGVAPDGTSPYTGLLVDPNIPVVTMGAGETSLSDLTAEHLLDMQEAVDEQAFTGNPIYLANRAVRFQLRRLKDANGNPIYAPMAGTTPTSVLDYELALSSLMPKRSDIAADTPFMLFGDFSSVLIGLYDTIELEQDTDFDADGMKFKARMYASGVCVLKDRLSILKTAAS